jgi:hypothetical protein
MSPIAWTSAGVSRCGDVRGQDDRSSSAHACCRRRSLVAFPEPSMALPSLARERRDDPPAGGVLGPRTQTRACAYGVSRTDAGRDVLRHRGRGAGGPEVTRGRRAPSTRGGQPIGGLRDVPVTQRGRMTPGRPPFRPRASRARAPWGDAGRPDRARSHEWSGRPCPESDALFNDRPLPP